MKRFIILTLTFSIAAVSISASDRQFSPRPGEGMPSSRSETNYNEIAAVYSRPRNTLQPVKKSSMMFLPQYMENKETPSIKLSSQYMQNKEAAQARRAEQSAARRAQVRAEKDARLRKKREESLALKKLAEQEAALARERAPRIEPVSRAYEENSNDVPDLRGERLAAYEKLEKRPSVISNWSRDWDQAAQIDAEKIEQWRPSKVYNALPERSWKDYFKEKSGFSSDWYAFKDRPLQRTREGLSSFGRGLYNPLPARDTVRARQYEKVFDAEPADVTRDSFAEEYEKMYEGNEREPRYGNRAWELEPAYGVPYLERIRSRLPNRPSMPNLSGASAYVPSWESIKEAPSSMWSGAKAAGYGLYNRMPSFRGTPTAGDILRENTMRAAVADQSTLQPSYWESVKKAPSKILNYFGENKRRALEQDAQQAEMSQYQGFNLIDWYNNRFNKSTEPALEMQQ